MAGCPSISANVCDEDTDDLPESGDGGGGSDERRKLDSGEVEVRSMNREEATAALMRCRPETGRGVGVHRLDVAEEFVVSPRPRRGAPSSSSRPVAKCNLTNE